MENTDTSITLTDLASLKNCIEIAASRGAYRAEEMTSVGHVFDRLATFLKAVEQQVSAAPEQAAPEQAPVDTQQGE